MNMSPTSKVVNFEVYLLMTMKIRMGSEKEAKLLQAKLGEYGLSLPDAERIYETVAKALDGEASRFENMKKLLGITDTACATVGYTSILWPDFDFKATADKDGRLESARYWHARGHFPNVDSPAELPTWSTDVTEFAANFGPMTNGDRRPLFDKVLPAHEGYEFLWNGERYGAEFSWGLFLYSAEFWE